MVRNPPSPLSPHAASDFDVDAPRGALAAQNDPAPDAPKPTILLVEDDDLVRSVCRRILEANGYNVVEAAHGAQALTLARSHPSVIHLLISDLNLPEVGGMEVAQGMRDLRPESKIMLVSGLAEAEPVAAEATDGRYPVLLKPFTAGTFLERVKAILGQG